MLAPSVTKRRSAPGVPIFYLTVMAKGCLLAALAFSTVASADRSATEAELELLRARAVKLQTELSQARSQRDRAREALRQHERRIGELAQAQRRTRTERRREGRRLEATREQARHERNDLAHIQTRLAAEVRAAYQLGRQDRLKLLLNQDDPARVARVLTYYRYLSEARAAEISRLDASLGRLAELEHSIEAQTRSLEALEARQREQAKTLEAERGERARLLAGLSQETRTRAQALDELRADQARLERLLGELREAPMVAPKPIAPADRGARFASLKGRLPLPARGQVVARFGQPKATGQVRWRGIFLASNEGETVLAPARGRVVYADWLRGFGLLLILDHGDGYMTLYAHNQSLARSLGDWVEAGESLATIGNTGDAPRMGLYFEIRHHGEPSDPLQWCRTGYSRAR